MCMCIDTGLDAEHYLLLNTLFACYLFKAVELTDIVNNNMANTILNSKCKLLIGLVVAGVYPALYGSFESIENE